MEQNTQFEVTKVSQAPENQEKSPVAAAVVITAIVVGFIVYAWQHSTVRSLQAELDKLRQSPVAEENGTANEVKKQAAIIASAFAPSEPGRQISKKDLDSIKALDYQFVPASAKGTTQVVEDKIAFGDVTGDGTDDAAVVIERKSNDGYDFFDLAVVTGWGEDKYSAATTLLGDRIKVSGVKIANGVISVNILTHRIDDAISNPTKPVTLRYRLGVRGLEAI